MPLFVVQLFQQGSESLGGCIWLYFRSLELNFFNVGLWVITALRYRSAPLWGLSKDQIVPFSRRRRGGILAKRFEKNFPRYVIIKSDMVLSWWLVQAFIFLASGAIHLLDIVCPRNVNSVKLNWHFNWFNFSPDWWPVELFCFRAAQVCLPRW